MIKSQKYKWTYLLVSLLVLSFVSLSIYAYTFYASFTDVVATIHEPLPNRDKSDKRAVPVMVTEDEKNPISVLVLGVDERNGDKGRSDTIIVLTINPKTNSTKLLSIPRDTRTEIIGKGKMDKINHAYAFGGVEMSIKTVEKFLDIPIDYYVQVNMEGFKDVVDALGGVTVQNEFAFTEEAVFFQEGDIQLDGDKALTYSRMRYKDPLGDFGRQKRQREVLKAVVNKGASISTLSKYNDIFEALGKNVKTNISFREMIEIQKNYNQASTMIESLSMKGESARLNGIYYFMVDDSEKQRIHTELKEHLALDQN